jgi:beta-lactamase class C
MNRRMFIAALGGAAAWPLLPRTPRAGVTGRGDLSSDETVQSLVNQEIYPRLPSDGMGGAAIAVRIDAQTSFFNYGWADVEQRRPVTSDSLFNLASLRKTFEATVLAQAFQRGELAFDDPVSRYVTELQRGGDISRVTIGQVAIHTSGLLLPSDHPPWPTHSYTLAEFIHALNDWQPKEGREPGAQHIYTHAGYVLLQLVLERRFDMPIADLLDVRVIRPLGLVSTTLPSRGADGRADLTPALVNRVVQGYGEDG